MSDILKSTDCPRTDAFLNYFRTNVGRVGDFKDWPTFARELERELAEAKQCLFVVERAASIAYQNMKRQLDADGMGPDWWSDDDHEAFTELRAALSEPAPEGVEREDSLQIEAVEVPVVRSAGPRRAGCAMKTCADHGGCCFPTNCQPRHSQGDALDEAERCFTCGSFNECDCHK